jgi:peptide chain release factor 2
LALLEEQIAQPQFWQDQETSQKILTKRKRLTETIAADEKLANRLADMEAYFELSREGENIDAELRAELDKLRNEVNLLETETLLGGESDHLNAIVTIHPGAGGTESQDWGEMLQRMYQRWAEAHGFKVTMNDYQPGDEAGLKSATFTVTGEYAYGMLQGESGVHRLVRISPFDAAQRRHTSFASVFVSPEIDDSITIEIKPDEIRTDTYRSGGKGGQHVNTTDSAVRITHIPTGLVAQCQNERSQHRNREVAMKMLKSRLYEVELRRRRQVSDKLEASKADIDFGSQIRSYVLHPYRMVKDHRTKFEVGDADRVLNGDLDSLIKSYLLSQRESGKAKG